MQRSQIFVQNRVFCLPNLHSTPPLGGSRRNIATPFGMEKLEWWGYPMVKKILKICLLIFTECTNVTDGQTDRRTDPTWWQRWCLILASLGKNKTKEQIHKYAHNVQQVTETYQILFGAIKWYKLLLILQLSSCSKVNEFVYWPACNSRDVKHRKSLKLVHDLILQTPKATFH